MKMVIELPEKTIAHIRSEYGHGKGFYPLNEEDKKIVNDAIYFGTPLPKGHGRLIDADSMIADILTVNPQFKSMIEWCTQVINAQPTVIEADGGKG